MDEDLRLNITITGDAEYKLSAIDTAQQSVTKGFTYASSATNQFGAAINYMGNQAQTATAKLNNANSVALRSTYTLFQLNQVVRDIPFGFIAISNNIPLLVDQIQLMNRATGSIVGTFKAMAAQLFSPAGITVGISVLISLFTMWSISAGKAKDSMEELNLEMLIGVTEADRLYKMYEKMYSELSKLSEARFDDAMSRLNEEMQKTLDAWTGANIQRMQGVGGIFYNLFFGDGIIFDDIKKLEEKMEQLGISIKAGTDIKTKGAGLLPQLRGQIESLEKERELATQKEVVLKLSEKINKKQDELNELLGRGKKKHEEILKINQEQSLNYYKWVTTFERIYKLTDQQISLIQKAGEVNYQNYIFGRGKGEIGGAPLDYKFPFIEASKDMQNMSEVTADVMRNNFITAWEGTLGEANSIFEQWIQGITEYFYNKWVTTFSLTFIDYLGQILGITSGGLFSELFGLSPSQITPTTDTYGRSGSLIKNTYYLVIGEEPIGKFVDERFPVSYNRSVRLGLV